LLRTPGAEELAVWNNAEAPEPPANLTATLKGAVIHRFCETFCEGDDAKDRLRESFEHVVAQRQSELAGRVFEIDPEVAVNDLLPLARNYLASDVFRRVREAQRVAPTSAGELPHDGHRLKSVPHPQSSPGVWSELRFRLRRPLGILTGTIDKLLIRPAANGGIDVEIVDFKTNRFAPIGAKPFLSPSPLAGRGGVESQASFDFENVATKAVPTVNSTKEPSVADQIENTARDYQLQMQSYALALRELLPSDVRINSLRATLHFIDPNLESTLAVEMLEEDVCAGAIDRAMEAIATLDGTLEAEQFPPIPDAHCRICNFLELCPAGREWLRS
jgi:hypothetical protein